ncbi:hypothetical protein SAMN05216351_108106 [Pseudobutyrivibrio sp. JW11]|uniref:hypothetical protein n=1 Tax=Pseudobutyrivibrio sp. JW11 TaxID=1855302 RepID=UPI0008EBECF9|nr:hypothetical protein [Pseudobutyrivibrio sp. JW11]SFO39941.1 hypothetical protein SAMN05216351_108106 [Pseudobutyrivibrio sp. JW11]
MEEIVTKIKKLTEYYILIVVTGVVLDVALTSNYWNQHVWIILVEGICVVSLLITEKYINENNLEVRQLLRVSRMETLIVLLAYYLVMLSQLTVAGQSAWYSALFVIPIIIMSILGYIVRKRAETKKIEQKKGENVAGIVSGILPGTYLLFRDEVRAMSMPEYAKIYIILCLIIISITMYMFANAYYTWKADLRMLEDK